MKVTEKKLADGVIKLDCEATAIEVNNALKEAAEAFALSMGVRPMPGKSIEELAKEQLGIADLDKIVEPNAIEVLVPRALDRRNLVPAFPPKATPTVKFERGKKFTFTLNVTVKPTYELTSYEPVEITVPPSPSTRPLSTSSWRRSPRTPSPTWWPTRSRLRRETPAPLP